jgi:hypothetical protein
MRGMKLHLLFRATLLIVASLSVAAPPAHAQGRRREEFGQHKLADIRM